MRICILVKDEWKVYKGHSRQAIKYEILIDMVAMGANVIFGYYKLDYYVRMLYLPLLFIFFKDVEYWKHFKEGPTKIIWELEKMFYIARL